MRAQTSLLSLVVAGLGAVGAKAHGAGDDDRWHSASDVDVEYGVGVRARYVGAPRGVLELFVEEASSGVARPGVGLELIRRRGGFEMIFGLELESLSPKDGLWLEKGDTPPAQTPDLVEFEGFGWITADITLVWHTPLHDRVALRYGGGLGVGVLRGELLRTDTVCSGATTDTCTPVSGPEQGRFRQSEDLPPVVPVVGALFGVQARPVDNLSISLEAGLRSVAYVGTSFAYFF